MKNIKITFLLGAGCECNEQLGIASGADFKKDIILSKGCSKLFYLLNNTNEYEITDKSCLFYNNHNVFYATIIESESEIFEELKAESGFYDYQLYIQNAERKSKEEYDLLKQNSESFKKFYKSNIYEVIKNNSENKWSNEFLKNVSLCSFLDGLFGKLRYPDKYKETVGKLLKIYYSAYQSIIKSFSIDFSKISELPIKERRELFCKMIKDFQIETIKNKKINKSEKQCYYQIIREIKAEVRETSIITTNYTDFAKDFTDLPDEKISYIHGNLNLFEDIKTKKVGEITSFDENEVIMPFLFLPSGVKPVVCDRQIQEYAKACRDIREADILFVLGYGLRSDDEHITNFLRERMDAGKEIVWFYHSKDDLTKVLKTLTKVSQCRSTSDFTINVLSELINSAEKKKRSRNELI